ncbi:cyclopropane-fatty-acyl-phospholipid synthase [Bradyrhizobiaceae bacterium SG-6C]|nr:cyclopropane-fatty-acyl-phospholipid synthase [Bradyrhizobiaceae bacterium SG-6C]
MSEKQARPTDRTGASPEAIMSHYDMGNDFFRLVLDPEMIYSCALFKGDDDLITAQFHKLDHHIEASGAAGTARVLDIGCGWGAMLRRLVDRAGVSHAVGLTLSPSQARWIREYDNPKIEVLEQDWRDHRPERRYDAIISVGAFEHFVQKGLDPKVKLDAYREFFAYCDQVLAIGGRLSLQTIAYSERTKVQPLLDKTFPDSDLPLEWEPIAAAEGTFSLIAARNDADHYYRTLVLWEQNLLANYDKAVALVGKARTDEFRRYLRMSSVGFRAGMVSLMRYSFRKKY